MRSVIIVLVAVLAATLTATGTAAAATPAFRDPALPVDKRVKDLLGRLTLDEKISLLHQYQPAIPRLDIGPFKNGTEALHGLAWSNDTDGNQVTAEATVFPQSVGLGATWDPDLLARIGVATGTEARGYNSADPALWGLQLWSPVTDLQRDPRWGRNEESYAEDPLLAARMATAYAGGLAGDDPEHLRTAPVLKHYIGYGNEVRRDKTSSSLRPRVKKEHYEVPFKAPIEEDAATGVMTAYNLINGRPATAHDDAGKVVRGWTDRTLFNVTDAFAPKNLFQSQGYYADYAQSAAAILKAGVDSFTQDGGDNTDTASAIKKAISDGRLTEADIDEAAGHALSIRVRLGEFDPGGGPYGDVTMDAVDTPEHRRLTRKAAEEQMTLLRNEGGTLPLGKDGTAGKVAVVGQLADTLYTDWYSGAPPYKVTPLDAITEKLGKGNVTSSEGVDRIAIRSAETGDYVTAPEGDGGTLTMKAGEAGKSEHFDVFGWGQGVMHLRSAANDKVVGRVGFEAESAFANDQDQPNGWFTQQQFVFEEAGDGQHVIKYAGYEVPDEWEGPNSYLTVRDDGALVLGAETAKDAARFTLENVTSGVESAVKAASGADAAVVVVGTMPFINGRENHDRTGLGLAESQTALIKEVTKVNPNTVVVLESSYPMTLGAEAKSVLWTSHAGQETGNAVAGALFGDVNPAGRLTQTWYGSADGLPDILDYDVIKAGWTYQYFKGDPLYAFGHGLSYTTFEYGEPRVRESENKITVEIPVTNTGDVAGDEVVQLYNRQEKSRVAQPDKKLRDFERVHLKPGQTKTVKLRVRPADLAIWDVTRNTWAVEKAEHTLMVGASSADIRQKATVKVDGETIPPRDLTKETRAADFDDYGAGLGHNQSAKTTLVDESKATGDAVGGSAGGWIAFEDADLKGGATGFTARAANEGGESTVEIRLDAPNGPLAGTLKVPSTGERYTYKEVSADVEGQGRHDVYLVFKGELRLSSFSFTGEPSRRRHPAASTRSRASE